MRRREEEELLHAISQDISQRYPSKFYKTTYMGVPDLLVRKGNKTIIIEFKNRPVTLLDIRRLLGTRHNEKVIASTSEALSNTSGSVIDYAAHANVRILDIDRLEEFLARL